MNQIMRAIFIWILLLVTSTCRQSTERPPPNILWIYVEDISPDLGCYGNTLLETPNLQQLSSDGMLFTNAISPGPVCSPVRSAMITGVMHTTLGLHNHHSSRTPASAIYLPDSIRTIPELFRQAGYFTFNSGKDDYNFWYDRENLYYGDYTEHPLYGKSGKKIDWTHPSRNGRPFFGQIQLSGGKHVFKQRFKEQVSMPVDRGKVNLPPYYPKDSIFVEEWAQYLDTHQITDREVGDIISKLSREGLLENTVIFFFSDHGMRALRHKQFLYEGGIHVPLILASYRPDLSIPKNTVNSQMVNLLDIPATSLALAEIPLPSYLDGRDLLTKNYMPPQYIISARDRCDFTIDRIRSVRSERYKYIRNFLTDRPLLQPNYRDEWQSTRHFRALFSAGQLNELQARIFRQERPAEEFYDLANDPHETINLVDSMDFAPVIRQHRQALENWIRKTDDQGQYPEGNEGLKYMLAIWGDQATNPEYDRIRAKNTDLAGSLMENRLAEPQLVETGE